MTDEYENDDYVDLMSSDWGESLDDADGESYESFIPEPEETDDEDYDYEDPSNCDHDDSYDYEEYFRNSYRLKKDAERQSERKRIIENDSTTERRKEVIRWVHHSSISKNFRNNNGFFVNAGPKMKLKNGHCIGIVNWLITEGICPNRYIAGYIITHSEASQDYPEKIMFFKIDEKECKKAKKYFEFIESTGAYCNFNYENEGIRLVDGPQNVMQEDSSTNRQKDILKWLSGTSLVIPFKKGNGFYIPKGASIKLKNGENIEIIDWLLREGFGSCKRVLSFSVKHTEENEKYRESLHFFRSYDDKE